MNYDLVKDAVQLIATFEIECSDRSLDYTHDIRGFKHWIADQNREERDASEPEWENKDKGRSAESTISTLLVHLNRYAKHYSKAAIQGSDFNTQEEFIYLINLKAFGEMSKIELIKKNVQEKPVGMQIIGRLIKQGWIEQQGSSVDKRSKLIKLTKKGMQVLDEQMDKIRMATHVIAGNLTHAEKNELIRLLQKLERFHQSVFGENVKNIELLDTALLHRELTQKWNL